MNQESKILTTADPANAGNQAPPEPIADHPRANLPAQTAESESPRNRGVGGGKEVDVGKPAMPGSIPADHRRSADVDAAPEPLFEQKDTEPLRSRWNEIQVGFVDEPHAAVEKADSLVAETIKRLADSFVTNRQRLEHEWDREGDVSTEGLRLALQRYRSFFNRLLSI